MVRYVRILHTPSAGWLIYTCKMVSSNHDIMDNDKVNVNWWKSLVKLNTMQLETPGGNQCCLMANDVHN